MKSEVTGIILAKGQSKRMGTNKTFVRLKGEPLIGYALDALQKVTANVILSAETESFHYKYLPVVKMFTRGAVRWEVFIHFSGFPKPI